MHSNIVEDLETLRLFAHVYACSYSNCYLSIIYPSIYIYKYAYIYMYMRCKIVEDLETLRLFAQVYACLYSNCYLSIYPSMYIYIIMHTYICICTVKSSRT